MATDSGEMLLCHSAPADITGIITRIVCVFACVRLAAQHSTLTDCQTKHMDSTGTVIGHELDMRLSLCGIRMGRITLVWIRVAEPAAFVSCCVLAPCVSCITRLAICRRGACGRSPQSIGIYFRRPASQPSLEAPRFGKTRHGPLPAER